MADQKTVTLDQFLTQRELEEAAKLYREFKNSGQYAKTVCARIIAPNLPRINAALGQENDAMFLAYAVEYVMQETQP